MSKWLVHLWRFPPLSGQSDRSYLITIYAMNRDLFLPHKLFYNRKPSLSQACYPGVHSAVNDDENDDDFSEDGDYRILGVKQELLPNKPEEAKDENSCKDEETNAGMLQNSATKSSRGFSRRLDLTSRVQSRESLYTPSLSSPRPDQQFDPRRSRSQPAQSSTKWPVTLELSGKKIQDQNGRVSSLDNDKKFDDRETTTAENTEANGNVEKLDKMISDSQKGIFANLPPLSQPLVRQTATPSHTKKMSFSPTFYADYGLRCEKTDTFPGLLHRRKRERSNVEIVRQVEEKANRHIYACQVLSNSKRGSKAAQSVNTLKQTVGPKRHSVSQLPTKFVREHLHHSPVRQTTFVDVSKRAPFSFFIRTRESPDFSRVPRHKTAPLPEINGRTLILGFDAKQ